MIISKTPLRISFAGGGSDLPAFYAHSNGAIISTAINKYIYITINKNFDSGYRLKYSETEVAESVGAIKNNIIRETLRYLQYDNNIEITSMADIPESGSGLGSSSSFTVGLINAINVLKTSMTSANNMATDACNIEINCCGYPAGKQDQYAAAYGGFNFMKFNTDGHVTVDPIIIPPSLKKELNDSLLLFYTGITRQSGIILSHHSTNLGKDRYKKIQQQSVELVYEMKTMFENQSIEKWVIYCTKDGC